MNNKPNIVFILLDDMGWKDIGCYGSEFYETPNIDRLAQEGMRFTDGYAACPVCSPTRASIMSGKYPATVGVTDWIGAHTRGKLIDAPYIDHLPAEEKSLAQALSEGGYNTWHIGKWHLGEEPYFPENHGFDVNIAGCEMGNPGRDGYFSPYNVENLSDGPEGEYLTDRLTTEAIDLIKNNDDHPFYLNLCYYAVHTPIMGKKEYVNKYKTKAKSLGLDNIKTFELGDNFPCEHKKNRRIKRRLVQSDPEYAAMVQSVDENVGRLMETLEEIGEAENTVIVFTSDNGGLATAEGSPTCNLPLNEGKGWMYEGGTREPMIIKWPGMIEPDSICSEPVTSPDFYPTLLEMAGLDLIPEQHQDGVSLVPLLTGENKSLDREAIYWHYPHYGNQGGTPGSSIRMGDYKLIEFFEDGRVELYNLRQDVGEKNNIAEQKPEIAAEMKQKLIRWRKSVEAKIPQPNPDWEK
ncbi:MAG: sulfatase [Bacillota bacterium]